MNWIGVTGLIYDIVGASMLAAALVSSSYKELKDQAGSPWGGFSPALFGALELQRHDARYGLSILITGFSLQLVAAFQFNIQAKWIAVLIVPLLVGMWIWHQRRKKLIATSWDRARQALIDRVRG